MYVNSHIIFFSGLFYCMWSLFILNCFIYYYIEIIFYIFLLVAFMLDFVSFYVNNDMLVLTTYSCSKCSSYFKKFIMSIIRRRSDTGEMLTSYITRYSVRLFALLGAKNAYITKNWRKFAFGSAQNATFL